MHPHGEVFDQYYPVDDMYGSDEDLLLAVVALGCAIKDKRGKK